MKMLPRFLLAAAVLLGTAEAASAYPAAARVAVNMRGGPGTNYRVLAVVPRAGIVDVRSCQPQWCQVAFRGRIGYVSRAYLQVRPAAQPRPLPPPRPAPPPRYDEYPYDRDPYPYDRDPYPYDPRPPYGPPGYGYPNPPDYYDPDPQAYVCYEDNTRWALGRPATRPTIDRIQDDSNARLVRIVRPGQVYTQEYSDERVNIEVDYRNIIVDIRCG